MGHVSSFVFCAVLVTGCVFTRSTPDPVQSTASEFFDDGSSSRSPYSPPSNSKFSSARRFSGVGESLWAEVSELAARYKPVDLGAGFPDLPPPETVAKPLREAVAKGGDILLHQYTRSYGHPRLVKALAAIYGKVTGRNINSSTEVLVTIGATEALFSTFTGLVNPGDEVIILEPAYDCYASMIRIAGGVPVVVPLRLKTKNNGTISAGDWYLDPEELESKFNSRTKLIVINTPHNPLGKVFSKEELSMVADLCKTYDVVAVMDEVYEWLVYDGKTHFRMNTLPGMWQRTITIGSAGKSFGVTGYKTGWAYGPANLLESLRLAHVNSVLHCPTPIQEAIAVGLETETPLIGKNGSFWKGLTEKLKQKRDRVCKLLRGAGMNPIVPESGYYVLADHSQLAENVDLSAFTGTHDAKFAKWLLTTQKLQGIPASIFYSEHKNNARNYIRLVFFKEDSTLDRAEAILERLSSKM